jgi:hypothetical protein
MKKVPPAPSGWDLTIEDLVAQMKLGKRKSVGSPETDWARDYERSLLPPDVRFPQKGDVYEAQESVAVHYMTAWGAPFTGGGEGQLEQGDRVFIDSAPSNPRPISVYAVACDYRAIEQRMVPSSVRDDPTYSDFYFSLKVIDLHRYFRLVETGYEKKG